VLIVLVVGRSWCGAAVGRSVLAWAVVVRRPVVVAACCRGGGGGLGWLDVSPVGGRGSGCGLGLLILCRRRPLCSVVRSAVGCLIVACRWHRLDGVVLPRLAGWLTVLAVLVLCTACLRLTEVVGFGKGEGE